MDARSLDDKLWGFAQHLLKEAQGDPVRALGLLVLVLQEDEFGQGPREAQRLLKAVRELILPDLHSSALAIQHLAGMPTWEGMQHCLRCGQVLFQEGQRDGEPFPSGYVFQVGHVFTANACAQFTVCQ